VCDYEKGGNSTTAMGLAERPDVYTIWVAANNDLLKKVLPFVNDVLGDLKKLLGLDSNHARVTPDRLENKCVKFARPRIKKELPLLRTASEKCISNLASTGSQKGRLSSELYQYLHRLVLNTCRYRAT
jgi:hypothetical protein